MYNIYDHIRMVFAKVFSDCVKEVDQAFPTDEDCFDEIYRIVSKDLSCKRCSETQFTHQHGERMALCDTCGTKTNFTAGTSLFRRIRKPKATLTALIASKNGIAFNANMLRTECKVQYETAYTIVEKIGEQANELLEEESLPVVSIEFNKAICRRSRETEANQHPVTEKEKEFAEMMTPGEDVVQKRVREFYGRAKEPQPGEDLPYYEDEQTVYDTLADGPKNADQIADRTTIHTSKIAASLMVLLLCGLVETLPGGRFKRTLILNDAMLNYNEAVQWRVAHAVEVIRMLFRGVSRRFIQRYIAIYWLFVDRSQADRDRLFERCFQHHGTKMNRSDYVSPAILSFPKSFHERQSNYSEYGIELI